MPYPEDPAADGRQETALWPLFWQTSSAHGIKPIVGAKSKIHMVDFVIITVNIRDNYRLLVQILTLLKINSVSAIWHVILPNQVEWFVHTHSPFGSNLEH